MRTSWLLAAAAAMGAAACAEKGESLAAHPPASASGFEPITPAPALRSHYLERRAGRCVIYSALGTARSAAADAPCPRELADGERARITGPTCVRESPDAARSVPMRCPKQLVWAARGGPPR